MQAVLISYLLVMSMLMNARYAQNCVSFFYESIRKTLFLFPCDIKLSYCAVRQKRVNNGKSDPCGPVHITIGDGGNREGLARK